MNATAMRVCVTGWVAVVSAAALPACAIVDKVDKVSNIQGLEEALVTEPLKKRSDPVGQAPSLSRLRATPSAVDFGHVKVASDNQREVAIFNPHGFAVTVVRVTVQGCDFALLPGGDERRVVAARSQLTLTVAFRPMQRRTCSGMLRLEIDSAGGRLTRVPLDGTGI